MCYLKVWMASVNYHGKFNSTTKIFLLGAILLKGFAVDSGTDFQTVIQQFSPELSDEYRGTSPRNQVPGTDVRMYIIEITS